MKIDTFERKMLPLRWIGRCKSIHCKCVCRSIEDWRRKEIRQAQRELHSQSEMMVVKRKKISLLTKAMVQKRRKIWLTFLGRVFSTANKYCHEQRNIVYFVYQLRRQWNFKAVNSHALIYNLSCNHKKNYADHVLHAPCLMQRDLFAFLHLIRLCRAPD